MRTTDRPYCPPNGSLLLEDEMRKRGEQRGSLRERTCQIKELQARHAAAEADARRLTDLVVKTWGMGKK